ncbi:MAG: hypothetical protein U0892_09385 [Pirellulales bacterium]
MQYNIRVRSIASIVAGILIMVAGMFGTFVTAWTLLLLPVGLSLVFKLEKDRFAAKLAVLKKQTDSFCKTTDHFYATVGGCLVEGSPKEEHIQAVEQSMLVPAAIGTMVDPENEGFPSGMRRWAWNEIERIEYYSLGKTLQIVHKQGSDELSFASPEEREQVLKLLRRATNWQTDESPRTVFMLNIAGSLSCLPFLFFAMALVFTALGLVQPNQLPLLDWNDIKNVRAGAKGKGWMLIWVLISQGYLYLVNNLPAAAVLGLGAVASIILGVVLYNLQWKRVSDIVWTHPPLRFGTGSDSPSTF